MRKLVKQRNTHVIPLQKKYCIEIFIACIYSYVYTFTLYFACAFFWFCWFLVFILLWACDKKINIKYENHKHFQMSPIIIIVSYNFIKLL